MILFLDANVIIYQVEGVEPFQLQVVARLRELVSLQDVTGFAVSRLSVLECLVKPVRERNRAAIERYRTFFSASDLRMVEISAPIIEAALLLRARHGLRTPDALQAASALSLPSPRLFVSGDRGFTRVPGLDLQLI